MTGGAQGRAAGGQITPAPARCAGAGLREELETILGGGVRAGIQPVGTGGDCGRAELRGRREASG